MHKIYRKNNYLIIDNGEGISQKYPVKDISIQELEVDISYEIFGTLPKLGNSSNQLLYIVSIPNILKQNDLPYTLSEWSDFYTTVTGGGSESENSGVTPIVYSLDRGSITETIAAGNTAQLLIPANAGRKGFEIQNLSSGDLVLGIGVIPSSISGFKISAGGSYNTTNVVSTRDIRIWGATTGQRFTFIEY